MYSKSTVSRLLTLCRDYLKWVPNSSFKKIRGSMGMKGILDIIGCREGKYIELEVKTERGRLTPWQQARIDEIRVVGGIAEVVRAIEDLHRIIEGSKLGISINF